LQRKTPDISYVDRENEFGAIFSFLIKLIVS